MTSLLKNLIIISKYDKIAYNSQKTEGDGKRMDKMQDAMERLRTYGQEHIIKLIEQLEGKEKEELIEQINKIDFHQIMELYDTTKKELEIIERPKRGIRYLRRNGN